MAAVFRGGLLAEARAKNGMTRLMAKSLLKGTKTRTAEQIADTIEAVGGSIGSDAGNNSFSVAVDVTQPDLRLGVEILADVLLNATMPETAVEREREVQLAGIREDEEHLTTVARNILREALFRDHPYALRGKGSADSVAKLTRKQLLAFRDRHLVARNGVISVFGNVKANEVRELFEKALGAMKQGGLALTGVGKPNPLAATVTVESLKEKAQGVLMVGFRGDDMFSEDRYALELIDEASSDIGSRFFVRICEGKGLASFVRARPMPGPAPGLVLGYFGDETPKN